MPYPSKKHECVVNSEHPYKNPDCEDGVLWGPCFCCDCYFCHVPDDKLHSEDCCSIYDYHDLIKNGTIEKSKEKINQ